MAKSRYTPLSTRLSVTTSLIVTVVMALIAIYVFSLKSDQAEIDNKHDVELNIANTALTINKHLSMVESAMEANRWNIDRMVTHGVPDSVVTVLRQLLTVNPDIVSCGVAFNIESSQSSRQPYIIYLSRNTEPQKIKISAASVTSAQGEYHWLETPFDTDHAQWTYQHKEPQELGYALEVYSYTIPIKGHDDQEAVVFFADIPSGIIGDAINYRRPEGIIDAYLINAEGKCLYRREFADGGDEASHFMITPQLIESLLFKVDNKTTEGNLGTFQAKSGNTEHLTFYDVINDSGWVLFYVSDFTQKSGELIRSTRLIVCGFLLVIVVIFFGMSFVIKRMIRPLTKFSDSAIEISKGNFDAALPEVNTNDEMSLLHDSFATMQRSIKRYTEELEESTRRQAFMLGELQVASRIQDDMLPKIFPPFPERSDIDIRAKLIPAKQIGGDLYNYFMRDNKVYFIIADVSGKSVPAALVMAIANNVFVTVSPQCSDPSDIMHELNITTCANNEHSGYFITVLVGILDLNNGELKLCNAGHDPSLIIDGDGNVSVLRIQPNLPVGIIDGYKYSSVTMTLTDHTRLVLYTDGITEAENRDRQFFGLNTLKDCVQDCSEMSNPTLIDHVISEVNLFATDTEKADDITIMVIDYKPSDVKMPAGITIFNDIREINKVKDFADAVTTAIGADENTAVKVNLALEEAVSNIIKYSFTQSGNNIITMFASAHKGMVTITISDTGKPFDPTKIDKADTEAPLAERPIGGLGITLIRTICKDMRYIRQNNHNYLTLIFDFNKQQ